MKTKRKTALKKKIRRKKEKGIFERVLTQAGFYDMMKRINRGQAFAETDESYWGRKGYVLVKKKNKKK